MKHIRARQAAGELPVERDVGRIERVADAVNALPEVAHNYAREHALNMWFVLATPTPDDVAGVIARIDVSFVPEPGTAMLLGLGLAFAASRRNVRKH